MRINHSSSRPSFLLSVLFVVDVLWDFAFLYELVEHFFVVLVDFLVAAEVRGTGALLANYDSRMLFWILSLTEFDYWLGTVTNLLFFSGQRLKLLVRHLVDFLSLPRNNLRLRLKVDNCRCKALDT